jgi:large subunit ribosomal protein L2
MPRAGSFFAGAAAAAAALLSSSRGGEAFVQFPGSPTAHTETLATSTRAKLNPPFLSAPVPPTPNTKAAGGLHLFACAAAAAAAVAVRARVALRAKGKPQTTSGIRVRRPMSQSLRNCSIATFEELTCSQRYEPLVFMHRRRFGQPKGKPIAGAAKNRTQSGHEPGKRARMYRIIDWGRTKRGMFGTIETVEYDPFRNARICLVKYEDGEKRYILHAIGYFVGQQVIADEDAPVFVGNAMPLDKIPIGTTVHNVETLPGNMRGGRIARAAGTSCMVLAFDDKYVTLKLPSSEVRLLNRQCWATIGKVGRPEAQLIKLGKAGKKRQLGFRPKVRGIAKNACDHPHGGGEGRSPIGHKFQKTPQGKCTQGLKTRRKNARSNRFILIRRKKKSGRA